MSRPTGAALLALIVATAVLRVALGSRTFSEVLDEPVHVAAGYDWLTGAPYTGDPTHPPLERLLSALPARLGAPLHLAHPSTEMVARGNDILYANDRYEENLAHARMGNLLFLAVGIVAVAWWGTRAFSAASGLVAAALYASLPPILGHAGVATTDMAVAAMLPLALVALQCWWDGPSHGRGACLGAAVGLGLLSKYSFPVFFLPCAAVVLALRWRPHPGAVRSAIVAAVVTLLVVWGGYRFDVGPISGSHPQARDLIAVNSPGPVRPAAVWFSDHVPVPAPLFVAGAAFVRQHDRNGHPTYLLGRFSQMGWWYYFPVVLFYKTPIPFLMLVVAALPLARTRCGLEAFLCVTGVLLVAMSSSINIGVRHVLPIYAPMAVLAGEAALDLWRRGRVARMAAGVLAVWLSAGVAIAHPDYLAWFNEAAGDHPERIVVDSNLDWGQDVLRLAKTAREMKIGSFGFHYVGNALLERHGLHAYRMEPYVRYRGWIATSETGMKLLNAHGEYAWLDAYRPVRRVGCSIRLYFVDR